MMEIENLERFRLRVRKWVEENLQPADGRATIEHSKEEDCALQAKIHEAGFAGIAVPTLYGGAGLTLEHQRIWSEEIVNYKIPTGYMVSLGMIMPTLLDCASEAVKLHHIPRMLRGEERWIQLLSEPSGGSDLAGVLTRAARTETGYVLNGSKMWSSGADEADYALCLARLDWEVPKHQGLGMFAISLRAKGVTIHPIKPVQGGPARFFIEYLDDVEIPPDYMVGGDGQGWHVAQRLLFHERNATAGVGYGYGAGGGDGGGSMSWRTDILQLAEQQQRTRDPWLASQIVDDYIAKIASDQLNERISSGMNAGKLQGHWGSLLKLGMGIDLPANAELGLAVSGADGVIWSGEGEGGEPGINWLKVRGISVAGGSNEIQRNIVSERLLGLPREPGDDKTVPFMELVKRTGLRV